MKFENTEVYGFKRALKGMRNPLESWRKNDTVEENGKVVIGENDLDLAQRLIKSGSEHRKFMRQIFVSVDITGPLYWWKEFDTYKVGTVANSCSTMHKIAAKRQCTNLRQHLLLPSVLKLTITIQILIMTAQNLVM